MSKYNYVVTAQKPTVVTHSMVGQFTSSKDLNLILGKSTRLEIHLMTADGLEPLYDVGLYGRILTMELFRPKESIQDRLFICTERLQFCVLAFDEESKEIVTKASGDLRHKFGRQSGSCPRSIIDPLCRMIGLQVYDGIFQVIGLDHQGDLHREAFDVRLDSVRVVSICFLHGYATKPCILVLHEDAIGRRALDTYLVNIQAKELESGPWSVRRADSTAEMLIPVPEPLGGALVVADQDVTYYNDGLAVKAELPPGEITAFGQIDDNRFLLGALDGSLYVLVLRHDGTTVLSIHVQRLGVTSASNTLSYLDNGHVFVGSVFGDSQVIRLTTEADEKDGQYFEILEEYHNLGAISDFTVVDMDRQGQAQIVTCSGAFNDGTLRVITNGIGINEEASIDLPGIQGVWSLRSSSSTPYDKYLIEAFVSETRVLAIEDEQLGEIKINGLQSDEQLLFCANMDDDLILSVSGSCARLIDCDSLDSVNEWTPENPDEKITMAHANNTQAVLALSGGKLVYFKLDDRKLSSISSVVLDHEISCLDISLLNPSPSSSTSSSSSSDVDMKDSSSSLDISPYVVVGLWDDCSIRVLSIPALSQVYTYTASNAKPSSSSSSSSSTLSSSFSASTANKNDETNDNKTTVADGKGEASVNATEMSDSKDRKSASSPSGSNGKNKNTNINTASKAVPRSVMMATLDGTHFLLCGLGDGHFINFHMDFETGTLSNFKQLPLGTQPISLTTFQSQGNHYVIAACDRPTVIYSSNGKLLFSNVNIGEIASVSSFNCDSFPDCIAFASDEALTIGGIEDIQKLHIDSVPLNEQPRRIVYHRSTHSYPVCTIKYNITNAVDQDEQGASETNFVSLFDGDSFEKIDAFQLKPHECHFDMQLVPLGEGDDEEKVVVGTAFVHAHEPEPVAGQIYVFRVSDDRKLEKILSIETSGAVYTLSGFVNNQLLAGINSKVQLYRWGVPTGADNDDAMMIESASSSSLSSSSASSASPSDSMEVDSGNDSKTAAGETLVPACSYHGSIIVVKVQAIGDDVLVGDLMKSASLLHYDVGTCTLEQVARDFDTHWVTALTALNDCQYLIADNSFNLFTLQRDPQAITDDDRARLDNVGRYHLGEHVNHIKSGSLVMTFPGDKDNNDKVTPSHIFATVNGTIGVIASLSKKQFLFFQDLERLLASTVQGVGGFAHGQWRSYADDRLSSEKHNFIDGDLIETFLDLPEETAAQVAQKLKMNVDELYRIVEEVVRIH